MTSNSRPTTTTAIQAVQARVGAAGRQKNERAADDDLVDERIENPAQRRHLAILAGAVAVEPIGAGGHDEHDHAGQVDIRAAMSTNSTIDSTNRNAVNWFGTLKNCCRRAGFFVATDTRASFLTRFADGHAD